MAAISVIIPVFNGAKTIKASIDSVLNQTFTDFELIIINSSSNDATLEVVSQISDPRIQVYTHPQANVAVNRNIGAKYATGEFITFLDADDLWTPDKLVSQYYALREKSQAAVAYSWTNAIDENDKFLYKCSHVQYQGDVFSQLLLDDFIGSGSNVMIRSSIFHKFGGFDGLLTNAQDTDLWIRLASKYEFVCISKVQIMYRVTSSSMSSNIIGLEKSNLQVIERAYSYEKAKKYLHLKQYSLANLYKYLTYKALLLSPDKHSIKTTSILIFKAIKYDVKLLFKPVLYKALIKLFTISLLPKKIAENLLEKFPIIADTSTLFGYIKVKYP
ncbi:glycosyltransferase family 2 protein [Calothrix sp. PCC 6303]|uniref:glycosyltransferase family 2 protein n=1 Tax=Calothrix sp. PCC 6303 TaxID=1170562 RepID=UPI0002A01D03|nr:glycosyltransferase [Calothrix sp. PCC 6303]AFZ02255.1 glycosyl transferase family 2 [Calothrix sp. PCC 6303]